MSKQVIIFINLTNGIEILDESYFNLKDCRFIRIPSTWCEQKRWEDILEHLSDDFLIHAALGNKCVVYDFGANKDTSRAIWQGIEWIKFVLYKRWLNIDYTPLGRAHLMGEYFEEQYKKLSDKTKTRLDYYGKFAGNELNIDTISKSTSHDGDYSYYINTLKEANGEYRG